MFGKDEKLKMADLEIERLENKIEHLEEKLEYRKANREFVETYWKDRGDRLSAAYDNEKARVEWAFQILADIIKVNANAKMSEDMLQKILSSPFGMSFAKKDDAKTQ